MAAQEVVTVAYTEADLANLKAALVSGVSRVTISGRTVEYRDVGELQRAIATVEASLASTTASGSRVMTRKLGFHRG